MKIVRSYRFYAAHRNELLKDKCRNIHGHTYFVNVHLEFKEMIGGVCAHEGNQYTFENIDKAVEPLIKQLDHGMLIHSQDPLLAYLEKYKEDTGDDLKLNVMTNVTSLENLAVMLFNTIKKRLPIVAVQIKETTSAEVIYNGKLGS